MSGTMQQSSLAAEAPKRDLAPLAAPFAAIRPKPEYAADVIARPYDVVSFEEARAGASGRPWSFFHVSRAEIDLPEGTDTHSPPVYAKAAEALAEMLRAGVLIRDDAPCYYAYRMTNNSHSQTGVALAGSVEAYRSGRIRRHEHTRPDKELDRTRQIEAVGAHTGLVLAAHRPDVTLAAILDTATTTQSPVADAISSEGTQHQIWRISDANAVHGITAAFEAMPAIWIADGHHRSAAALRVSDAASQSGSPSNGRFLLVSFAADRMRVLDYNRVVRDLVGRSTEDFLAALAPAFDITPSLVPVRPERPGTFGMFVAGQWFLLTLREMPGTDASPVERLDVSLLNDRLLAPILGIADPRTDSRIDFIGGGRGLPALEERVNSGGWAVAFSMHPTRLEDVMAVADAGQVMPPKSTWFEPKLADGLLSLPLR